MFFPRRPPHDELNFHPSNFKNRIFDASKVDLTFFRFSLCKDETSNRAVRRRHFLVRIERLCFRPPGLQLFFRIILWRHMFAIERWEVWLGTIEVEERVLIQRTNFYIRHNWLYDATFIYVCLIILSMMFWIKVIYIEGYWNTIYWWIVCSFTLAKTFR